MTFFSAKNFRDYQARAESCQRLAEAAPNPSNRETLLHLAMRWRGLAEQEEAKLHPPSGARAPSQSLGGRDEDSGGIPG